MKGTLVRSLGAIGVAAVIGVASASTASAETFDFPAGLACPAFDLRVTIEDPHLNIRTFHDREGNAVRMMRSGRGYDLTFRNLSTGESISFKSSGFHEMTRYLEDGSQLVQSEGHQVLILFPSDEPPGPTTTFTVGRVVLAIDAQENYTRLSQVGRTLDICAAIT